MTLLRGYNEEISRVVREMWRQNAKWRDASEITSMEKITGIGRLVGENS